MPNLLFTHASEYAIVISDTPLGDIYEDVSASSGMADNVLPIDFSGSVTDGVGIPAAKLPKIKNYSTKKRRYRILRRRKLDELAFVY